ncbi:MAG: molybdenum cofactor biosynthesis protein MoaE, partial [Solirubrobacteraceae bacterium]
MTVRVRLFAVLRERAGRGEIELELPEKARVSDALERLSSLAGDLSVVMAVNRSYATPDTVLHAGDELALVPPVSGGASGWYVRVGDEPLTLDTVRARVRGARAGAIVCFEGVTREVSHLDYEAYTEMAEEQIRRIVEVAVARHRLCAAAVEHRVGQVALSEPSVVVAVSAPHRGEACAGARETID